MQGRIQVGRSAAEQMKREHDDAAREHNNGSGSAAEETRGSAR